MATCGLRLQPRMYAWPSLAHVFKRAAAMTAPTPQQLKQPKQHARDLLLPEACLLRLIICRLPHKPEAITVGTRLHPAIPGPCCSMVS